tara:strand:+ start:143 stop:595 length:453 start_codon:yes stop_codon:yes gene_type:complete
MILDFCAVCGITEDLHHHHFTPRIEGGIDDETNLITLCYEHHCEIHGKPYRNRINHAELTRRGMQKARERGIKLGNPNLVEMNKTRIRKARKYAWEYKELLISLRDSGMTLSEMCNVLESKNVKTRNGSSSWFPSQVRRMLTRIENGLLE